MRTPPIHVTTEPLDAVVTVAIADRALADATATAIASALRKARASFELASPRVVRLRTRRRLARLLAKEAPSLSRLEGAIVVVRVTGTNARHLVEMVEAVRKAGALGVQLVWDGVDPARERVERHVFAVLERARSTPAAPPVVLSKDVEPALSLRILVEEHRSRAGVRAKEGSPS